MPLSSHSSDRSKSSASRYSVFSNWPIPTLVYHLVNPNVNDRLSITPRQFAQHIRALVRASYNVVSISALIGDQAFCMPSVVAVTFDDGYADNVQYALPIIAEYTFSASMFLSTAFIGQENLWNRRAQYRVRHASRIELRAWIKAGMDIQSHGHDHQCLLKLTDIEVLRDLSSSVRVIESLTKRKPCALAYPYGQHNLRVRNLASHFFRFAFGVGPQVLTSRLCIPRLYVDRLVSAEELVSWVRGTSDPTGYRARKYYM